MASAPFRIGRQRAWTAPFASATSGRMLWRATNAPAKRKAVPQKDKAGPAKAPVARALFPLQRHNRSIAMPCGRSRADAVQGAMATLAAPPGCSATSVLDAIGLFRTVGSRRTIDLLVGFRRAGSR